MIRNSGIFRVLVLFVALSSVGGAIAEEGAWTVTLADAVERALIENLDIAIARVDPKLSREAIASAEGVFQDVVTVNGSWNRSQTEPTSDFSPSSQTARSINSAWSDSYQWGGQVSASFAYSEFISDYTREAIELFGLVPVNMQATVRLQYTQSLLRNFGLSINRTSIEQAKNNLRISEENFADAVMVVVKRVEDAYWDLVGAQRSVEVERSSLALAEDFLRETKIKVEVGTLPPIEITTAEAAVADRQEGVIVAENNVRSAEDTLRALMRIDPSAPEWDRPIRTTDEPRFQEVKVDMEEAVADALKRRPVLRAQELALENNRLAARFRRNQLRPDLSVTGSYDISGNNFEAQRQLQEFQQFDIFGPDGVFASGDEGFVTMQRTAFVRVFGGRGDAFSEIPDRDNTAWTLSFNLSIPLGNKTARAEYSRSLLEVNRTKLNLELLRQDIRVEVRNAVRNLETSARRVASARANLVQQRRKVEAEQKRYENGLSTAYTVLLFQNDLRNAESREISALIDYSKALVALARSRGTLLLERGIRLGNEEG